jgi:AbiV family abortive infection protein
MPEDESTKRSRPYSGRLTALEAASALQAARLNALDLLDTADILYNLKRFAHSLALSTLAIEEAGKLPLLLSIFLGFSDELPKLWRSYRRHQEKTRSLNLGIEARVRATYPEIPHEAAWEIGQRGLAPDAQETLKQRAVYSDCLETADGFVCHLPRNIDWRRQAWDRLCEAQALVLALRDYPPEELEVWLQHAKEAQSKGGDFRSMLEPLHRDLLERGFVQEGWWNSLLADIHEDNKGA